MGFELREHTADVAVAATGASLPDVFAAVADGLAAAAADSWPDDGERDTLTVRAEHLEALLFEYLDELIYCRDVREALPVDNHVEHVEEDGEWTLEASARWISSGDIDAREVKAVTYSEMRLAQTEDGAWEAYVVFDV